MNASPTELVNADLLSQFSMSRDFAQDCDAADILAPYRKQFELPLHANGQPLIYSAGHSGLGAARRARLRERRARRLAQLGVAGHHTATRPWIDYAQNFTKGLQHVTGAQANEVVAMNSLTINLHLMMASFYRPVGMRDKVLIEAGAFSSDRHAILGQLSWHKLDPEESLIEIAPRAGEETLRIDDIEAKIEELGSELALVLWLRRAVPHRPGVRLRAHHEGCARPGRHRSASIWRTPSAICRCSFTTGMSTSRCGALTNI
jgi:kynureninase